MQGLLPPFQYMIIAGDQKLVCGDVKFPWLITKLKNDVIMVVGSFQIFISQASL